MRILEIISGTGSLAKAARARGHTVVAVDICRRHTPTVCVDLLEWDPSATYPPDYFTYIHASCPCEAYSKARTTRVPRPLELADSLVEKTLAVFNYFSAAFWTVENPAGSLLWQRAVARPLLEQIAKTNYCVYAYPYRKHTWFANNFGLKLRRQCDGTCGQMVGRRHRQHAQRGGGGAENVYHSLDELHSIPPALCQDIVEAVEHVVLVEAPAPHLG